MTVPSLAPAQSAMKFASPIFLVALYLASKVFAAALPVDIAGSIDLVRRQGVGSSQLIPPVNRNIINKLLQQSRLAGDSTG